MIFESIHGKINPKVKLCTVNLVPVGCLMWQYILNYRKYLKVNEIAKMECALSHPQVPVAWTKNNERLYQSQKHNLIVDKNQHILEISNVSSDDYGFYKCLALSNPDVVTSANGNYI